VIIEFRLVHFLVDPFVGDRVAIGAVWWRLPHEFPRPVRFVVREPLWFLSALERPAAACVRLAREALMREDAAGKLYYSCPPAFGPQLAYDAQVGTVPEGVDPEAWLRTLLAGGKQ
jgi:hypothetical protein